MVEFSVCGFLLKLIFCLVMPPIAVILAKGGILPIIASFVLTMLWWIPGMLYALWFCFLRPS
ncbi:hypothetical protein ANCCAN_18242 [Ancylostoma caninum]|uniref:Proteolipid membrane potential modulator n=1 Tax=Ancylostoma caninum TaxID=29170 RepID=A0A368FUJ0_ANCCA|nr:hypothetical protein ANCCAN_18242 [Ancylostoma caninum]